MRRAGLGWAARMLLASSIVGAALEAPAQVRIPSADAALAASLDGARAAFERLSEGDRIAVQDALVWTGDYTSVADGSFGRRTFEAIQAYQRRIRQPATGILEGQAVAALVAAGARVRTASGFTLVQDTPTGIRLGVPETLLPKRSLNGSSGSRFQSADGRITLDTRAQEGDEDDLKQIYERNLAIQSAGRTVGYRLLRPDFFVIGGETQAGKFFSRYALGPTGIRAFSIGYDKALASEVDRIVVAIANSFEPFPAPAGYAAGRPGPPPPRPSGRGEPLAQTGLAVTPRRVLTAAAGPTTCREPQVDGAPARLVAGDPSRGLVLLETTRPHRTAPLVLAGSDGTRAAALVLFIAPAEGGKAVATPAELLPGGRLTAALQPGAAGAVVLDPTGAIMGMVPTPAAGSRAVAGLVPPAIHPYLDAAEIGRILGPDAPPAATSGDAPRPAGAIAPALASVTCESRAP